MSSVYGGTDSKAQSRKPWRFSALIWDGRCGRYDRPGSSHRQRDSDCNGTGTRLTAFAKQNRLLVHRCSCSRSLSLNCSQRAKKPLLDLLLFLVFVVTVDAFIHREDAQEDQNDPNWEHPTLTFGTAHRFTP